MRALYVIVLASLLSITTPILSAADVGPAGAVMNGGFEIDKGPGEVGAALVGTPADACFGVGHQVIWGEDTVQGDATGATPLGTVARALWVADDPEARAEAEGWAYPDPAAAAARVTADPEGEALASAGYGRCVYDSPQGHDVAWQNPAGNNGGGALFWSGIASPGVPGVTAPSATEAGYDFDADPTDREARIAACATACSDHNMWQVLTNGAWSGNFDALTFRVEGGSISNSALVQISLTATPLETQHPWVGIFIDCQLNFRLKSHGYAGIGAGTTVTIDPLDAGFANRYDEGCADAKALWDDPGTTDQEKRDLLGRLRLVQVSFWDFNKAAEDAACACAIVIDDVQLSGATTVAEEAARGNVRTDAYPNPLD